MDNNCNECKNPGKLSNFQWGGLLLGVYLLSTSIYGTVKLFEKIISLF